jgi:hypothetical protein
VGSIQGLALNPALLVPKIVLHGKSVALSPLEGSLRDPFRLSVLTIRETKLPTAVRSGADMPPATARPRSALRALFNSEASGGIVLMGAAALALVVANSPVSGAYFGVLHSYVLGLSVLHWATMP